MKNIRPDFTKTPKFFVATNYIEKSPRFEQNLEPEDIESFNDSISWNELCRLKYLIDRQFENVSLCDNSFDKLKNAFDFTKSSRFIMEKYIRFLKANGAHCDCEIMLNVSDDINEVAFIEQYEINVRDISHANNIVNHLGEILEYWTLSFNPDYEGLNLAFKTFSKKSFLNKALYGYDIEIE